MSILYRLALLAALLGAQPVAAQWPSAAPDSARRDFRQRLLQALDLTPDQRDSLRQRRQALQLDLEALRLQLDEGDLLPEEGRLRYRELLEVYRSERDSLLTPQQLALLERARAYQREQALADGAQDTDAPPRLVDALQLTAAQRRRWLALLARQRDQVQQREAAGQPVTAQDLMRLREEHRLAFEAILTPEQRLELERYRQTQGHAATEAEPGTDLDLLDDQPGYRDAWRSLESDLGEDGAEP